jgi:hypothetical protein
MDQPPKVPFGPRLQDLIHRFEVGAGKRTFRWGLIFLGVLFLVAGYNLRAFRNMNNLEAMDAAQLARNLSEGKGYTTLFVRPLSIYLLTNHNASVMSMDPNADVARLNGSQAGRAPAKGSATNAAAGTAGVVPHPDLANPPVYPVVLAALMKVIPTDFDVSWMLPNRKDTGMRSFWTRGGGFWWYPPDFCIAVFNQLLFLVAVWLTFKLARRLFDAPVAWLSAIVMLGSELFWRFTVSGLSTILLLLVFLGLAWCLSLLEQSAREPATPGSRRLPLLSAVAGLVTAIGGLTRYAFGWLIVPVVIFILLFSGTRRVVNALVAFAVFFAVMTPWMVRNYQLSGTPFGTATFAVAEGTPAFGEFKLQRSLQPNLGNYNLTLFWYKLLGNARPMLSNDLPKLGGSWVSAFFLVGLLLAFKNPAISRLRYFVLLCLPFLALAQMLGRTQLSEQVPEINSENLIVLVAPLAMVFGISLFFTLLDQMALPIFALRYVVTGAFAVLVCLPMLLVFAPPRSFPIAYPPYYPPFIQRVSHWMNPPELMMSDVPWAVAWYGKRQCIWLTLNAREDFYAVNDWMKRIRGLYLTPETTDSRFLTQWARVGEFSWGNFVMAAALRGELPPRFPLYKFPGPDDLPSARYEQFFVTDYPRWLKPGSP